MPRFGAGAGLFIGGLNMKKDAVGGLIRLKDSVSLPGYGTFCMRGGATVSVLTLLFRRWDSQPYLYGGKSTGLTARERCKNAKPIDCSGFFGVLLDELTDPLGLGGCDATGTDIHDRGSWQQWGVLSGYRSPGGFGLKKTKHFTEQDDIVRAFYLSPEKTASGIGHIGFVLNGLTIESCGSQGVCRRLWDPSIYRWMPKCTGFVLSVPRSDPFDEGGGGDPK